MSNPAPTTSSASTHCHQDPQGVTGDHLSQQRQMKRDSYVFAKLFSNKVIKNHILTWWDKKTKAMQIQVPIWAQGLNSPIKDHLKIFGKPEEHSEAILGEKLFNLLCCQPSRVKNDPLRNGPIRAETARQRRVHLEINWAPLNNWSQSMIYWKVRPRLQESW